MRTWRCGSGALDCVCVRACGKQRLDSGRQDKSRDEELGVRLQDTLVFVSQGNADLRTTVRYDANKQLIQGNPGVANLVSNECEAAVEACRGELELGVSSKLGKAGREEGVSSSSETNLQQR